MQLPEDMNVSEDAHPPTIAETSTADVDRHREEVCPPPAAIAAAAATQKPLVSDAEIKEFEDLLGAITAGLKSSKLNEQWEDFIRRGTSLGCYTYGLKELYAFRTKGDMGKLVFACGSTYTAEVINKWFISDNYRTVMYTVPLNSKEELLKQLKVWAISPIDVIVTTVNALLGLQLYQIMEITPDGDIASYYALTDNFDPEKELPPKPDNNILVPKVLPEHRAVSVDKSVAITPVVKYDSLTQLIGGLAVAMQPGKFMLVECATDNLVALVADAMEMVGFAFRIFSDRKVASRKTLEVGLESVWTEPIIIAPTSALGDFTFSNTGKCVAEMRFAIEITPVDDGKTSTPSPR